MAALTRPYPAARVLLVTMKPRKPRAFALPETVDVAGHSLVVRVTADIDDLGNFDLATKTLYIREDLMSNPELAMDTLRHELMHAALGLGGIGFALSEDVEEGVVRAMEQLFIPAWNRVVENTPYLPQ